MQTTHRSYSKNKVHQLLTRKIKHPPTLNNSREKLKFLKKLKSPIKEQDTPSKERTSLERGKPNSTIMVSLDEMKAAKIKTRMSSVKKSKMTRSSIISEREKYNKTSQQQHQAASNSKFFNAFKKKEKKIGNVIKNIKMDLKNEKMRMLEFHDKDNLVDYDDGYREIKLKGFENASCWMTDPSESSEKSEKESGFLPLRSEVDY